MDEDDKKSESVRIHHKTWAELSQDLVGVKGKTFADRIDELCEWGRLYEAELEKIEEAD